MSDNELQVFISSKMRKDALQAERNAAVQAARCYPGIIRPWHWEICGYAAPYPPMKICLEAVRNSDILILLLGYDLTDNTREEHRTAVRLKIPDFIFVKQGRLKKETRGYLALHQNRATYMVFKSISELKTMVAKSLSEEIRRGYRNGRSPRLGTRVPYSSGSTRKRNG